MKSPLHITPFSIQIEAEILSDLRERIRNTRWPDQAPGTAWEQGTDREYLRRLLAYWADEFDWGAQERRLNASHQFRAELDGVHIHFVHERSRQGRGIPLILTHGWPSTFAELLPLVPFLTDPKAHGFDGPAFDVVIPSLIDHMDLGESFLDNALAFDHIAAARHAEYDMTGKAIVAALKDASAKRIIADAKFQQRAKDIERYLARKNRKVVSLNEETLRRERDEDKAARDVEKEEEERETKADKLPVFAKTEYDDEVLHIAVDYASLLKAAKTAAR